MSRNAITHVVLTDDDGSGTTGTILNNSLFDQLQDAVDDAIARVYAVKSGGYTVAVTDDVIRCTSALTLTLYTASGNSGRELGVINDSTGNVTLDGNGSQTIDGSTTFVIPPGARLRIVCDGSNWRTVSPIQWVLDRDVTAVTVNGDGEGTTETTVYSYTVPGGTLGTTRRLRLEMQGDCLNNTGGNRIIRFRVKFGATTVFDTGAGSITMGASGASRGGVQLYTTIAALNATNAQVATTQLFLSVGSGVAGTSQGVTAGATSAHVGIHNAVAEDSTADKALVVTAQLDNTDATLDFTCRTVMTEVL